LAKTSQESRQFRQILAFWNGFKQTNSTGPARIMRTREVARFGDASMMSARDDYQGWPLLALTRARVRERPDVTLVEPGLRRADHERRDISHGMSSGIPLLTAPDGACPGSSRLARPPARVRRPGIGQAAHDQDDADQQSDVPGRFVVARSAAVSKKCCPLRGDRGFESCSLQQTVCLKFADSPVEEGGFEASVPLVSRGADPTGGSQSLGT
jgi:hypothetical protein